MARLVVSCSCPGYVLEVRRKSVLLRYHMCMSGLRSDSVNKLFRYIPSIFGPCCGSA